MSSGDVTTGNDPPMEGEAKDGVVQSLAVEPSSARPAVEETQPTLASVAQTGAPQPEPVAETSDNIDKHLEPRSDLLLPVLLLEWAPVWVRLRAANAKFAFLDLIDDRLWSLSLLPKRVNAPPVTSPQNIPVVSYLGPGLGKAVLVGAALHASVVRLYEFAGLDPVPRLNLWAGCVAASLSILFLVNHTFSSLLVAYHHAFRERSERLRQLVDTVTSNHVRTRLCSIPLTLLAAVLALIGASGIAIQACSPLTERESTLHPRFGDLLDKKLISMTIKDGRGSRRWVAIQFETRTLRASEYWDCVDFSTKRHRPKIAWTLDFPGDIDFLQPDPQAAQWRATGDPIVRDIEVTTGRKYRETYYRSFSSSNFGDWASPPPELRLLIPPAAGASDEYADRLRNAELQVRLRTRSRCEQPAADDPVWQFGDQVSGFFSFVQISKESKQ